MVYFLSTGSILIVVTFSLVFLVYTMRGGKEANLLHSGLFIFALGALVGIVARVLWYVQWLPVQESGVLANTGIAILLTGFIAALQAKIQKDWSNRRNVLLGAIAPFLIGLAFIIIYSIAR